MEYDIVKMGFSSPLHLSDGRPDTYARSKEMLHSDTLKSAIFSNALQLEGIIDHIETDFSSFRVSSAFPFYGNYFFLPKPMLTLPFDDNKENLATPERKKIKKIKWIEKSIFEKFSKGIVVDRKQDCTFINEFLYPNLFSSGYLPTESLMKEKIKEFSFIKKEQQQRLGEDPFEIERNYFKMGSGLFFIVAYENERGRKILESGVRLLADSGIGTDRTVGNGFFDFEFSKLKLDVPEKSNFLINLSLYIPEVEHGLDWLEEASYSLKRRASYMAGSSVNNLRHLRTETIFSLGEGSVLPNNVNHTGSIHDLAPKWNDAEMHAVWRDGRPILLPFLKKEL